MALIGYDKIRDLAAQLAGRVPITIDPNAGLEDSENAMLAATFASELSDLWNKEAWPELCKNLEQVTVTDNLFSKRIGDPNEMGDILGVYDADPRGNVGWASIQFSEEDDQVRIQGTAGQVFVDWQDPVTVLDDLSNTELTATELPSRFRLPLAYVGAAALLDAEDAGQAQRFRAMAEREIQKQVARMPRAWWRAPRAKGC